MNIKLSFYIRMQVPMIAGCPPFVKCNFAFPGVVFCNTDRSPGQSAVPSTIVTQRHNGCQRPSRGTQRQAANGTVRSIGTRSWALGSSCAPASPYVCSETSPRNRWPFGQRTLSSTLSKCQRACPDKVLDKVLDEVLRRYRELPFDNCRLKSLRGEG